MMNECYNCKSLMSCLHSGHVHLNDNMGLRCDFFEKAGEIEMRQAIIIDGIVYKRITDMEDQREKCTIVRFAGWGKFAFAQCASALIIIIQRLKSKCLTGSIKAYTRIIVTT